MIWDFVLQSDTTQIESKSMAIVTTVAIMITTINYIRERVNTVQKILMVNGFNKNKIVIIEGKGRVLLTNNPLRI
jgi:hypothetical protein